MKSKLYKTLIVGALTVSVAAPNAHAVFGVGDVVFVAGDITWIEQAAEWAKNLEQWAKQIEQATATVNAVKTVIDYAGNPKLALSSLGDFTTLIKTIGVLTGEERSADSLASSITSMDYSLKRMESAVGNTMDVYGSKTPRNVSLYQAAIAAQDVIKGTRDVLRDSRANERMVTKKLEEADAKLVVIKGKSNPTQSEILTQQLEVDRLRAMLNAMQVRNQSAVADAELKAQEDISDQRLRAIAANEEAAAQGQAKIQGAQDLRKQTGESLGAGFNLIDRTPIDYESFYSKFTP